MRVTCSVCTESYAVSDEKLRGRVVRIRCRRCQTPMVLDGRSSWAPGSDAPLGAQPPVPSWDTPAPRLNRHPLASSAQTEPLPATLGSALHAPGRAPQAPPPRALIESIDIELEEDEVPPTARSSQFPDPPGERAGRSMPPPVPVLQPIPGQRRRDEPPPLPREFQQPFGPFSPTPSSGNAFPWLQAAAPLPASLPPGQLSLGPQGVASRSFTASPQTTYRGFSEPPALNPHRTPFGAPTEDEDTVAMSRQELMAAANASTEPRRPFLPPTAAAPLPPAVPEAQEWEPTEKGRAGSRLTSLLFLGAALGAGGVWLKAHVWPEAQRAPTQTADPATITTAPVGGLHSAPTLEPSLGSERRDLTRGARDELVPGR